MEAANVSVDMAAGTITLSSRDGEETISFDELLEAVTRELTPSEIAISEADAKLMGGPANNKYRTLLARLKAMQSSD